MTHNTQKGKVLNNKLSQVTKRKFIKGAAAGMAAGLMLPENWKKPIVNSVMLLAHAQTSVVTAPTIFEYYGRRVIHSTTATFESEMPWYVKALDWGVKPSMAQVTSPQPSNANIWSL